MSNIQTHLRAGPGPKILRWLVWVFLFAAFMTVNESHAQKCTGTAVTVNQALPTSMPFSFTSGNAFAFIGGVSDDSFNSVAGNLSVTVNDGGTYTFGSTNPFSFLGYVSNSASFSSVGVTGPSNNFLQFSSFSLGNAAQNPGGGNGGAVPEPGTVVSMGLLGAGVLGLVVRSRRRMSN